MTVESIPHTTSKASTEAQLRRLFRLIPGNGVVRGIDNECAVTTPGGLDSQVDTGHFEISGFLARVTAAETLTHSAADATNDRVDLVIARYDPDGNGAGDGRVTFVILEGTPGSGAPALTQEDEGIWEEELHRWTIAAGAGVLSGGVDNRPYAPRFSSEDPAAGAGLFFDAATGLFAPSTDYVSDTEHTKALHDALGIDAETLDGIDSSGFAAAVHAARHANGGADEIAVEGLGTAAVDTDLVLKPDGAGGVGFGAISAPDRAVIHMGNITGIGKTGASAQQLARSVGDASGQYPAPMDRPGSIVGIVARDYLQTGTEDVTFEVYINGVATGFTVVCPGSGTRTAAATQEAGLDTYAATDRVDVRATVTADAGGTNGSYEALVVIQHS